MTEEQKERVRRVRLRYREPNPLYDLASSVGGFVLGLVAAGVATIAVALVAGEIGAFFLLPGLMGPVAGGIMWYMFADSNRAFARGALVAGITLFLILGGCLALFSVGPGEMPAVEQPPPPVAAPPSRGD